MVIFFANNGAIHINTYSNNKNTLNVVGIGASAGGLGALSKLLANIKPGNNTAYVIAQHMGKDNFIAPLLSLLRRIAILPVVETVNNALLVPDQIFLISPGVSGVIQRGRIQLLPITSEQISSPSVNALFHSIAREYLQCGIGVILSGAGNDGLAGARSIKGYGGMMVVQSPASTQMDGMPSAIIGANLADHILLPEEIGQFLNGCGQQKKSQTSLQIHSKDRVLAADELDVLQQLLRKVFEATGKDFSNYKEETLLRRINRRMLQLNIVTLTDYLTYTYQHPDELTTLQQQFLISVSSFFRDHESFLALKKALAELIARKAFGDAIRIWVPGCASGEECYSFAILLAEILGDDLAEFDIKIIGSDLNKDAIAMARAGIYRSVAFREMSPTIVSQYLAQQDAGYQVKAHIRQLCEFRLENVLEYQLAEKFDVISCRNLLIYLKAPLQDLLIKAFYDGLFPQGLLFIGQSETIGLLGGTFFTPVDHFHRVYTRKKNNVSAV